MRFSNLFTAVVLATGFTISYAQSVSEAIGNFQMVTRMSSDLNDLTASINLVNVLFKGPQVGQGLVKIGQAVSTATEQMDNQVVFGDLDAVAIVGVLKTFVTVHQRLLNTVIGKHGILSLFFFTEPVRVALVQLEAIVDSFALALIDMIPTQAPAADQQFISLSITIDAAITVYS